MSGGVQRVAGVVTLGALAAALLAPSAPHAARPAQQARPVIGPTIAAGTGHGAFVSVDGRVWTWGENDHGQLGRPDGFGQAGTTTVPEPVPGVTSAIAVAVSDDHTLIAASDGRVWAFGADGDGELGTPDMAGPGRFQPEPVPGIVGAHSVAAGPGYSVVLTTSGHVWTFGRNRFGRLGRDEGLGAPGAPGAGATPGGPAPVVGLAGVTAIAAGADHVLARRVDGSVWGFGANTEGQLGPGPGFLTYDAHPAPRPITGLSPVRAIAAGDAHSVVTTTDATVYAFGSNSHGQLGTTEALFWRRAEPRPIAGLTASRTISASATHTVIAAATGELFVAGGAIRHLVTTPTAVGTLTNPAHVAAGPAGLLAVGTDGTLWMSPWYDEALPPLPTAWTGGQVLVPIAPVDPPDPPVDPPDPPVDPPDPPVHPPDPPVDPPDPPVDPPPGSGFVAVSPARLVETRVGATPTVDARYSNGGRLAAGSTTVYQMTGRAGVPTTAASVALNVTAIAPAATGYLTVFACGTIPNASNVNFSAGQTIPNLVVTGLSASGEICVFTSVSVDLAVDLTGWFTAAGPYRATGPARLADTRPGASTIDGRGAEGGPVAAGGVLEIPVAGRGGDARLGGVALDAAAALLNIVAVDPEAVGYVTVYPCTAVRPTASTLNLRPRQTIANAAAARLSASGTICLYSSVRTHLIVDVTGSFTAPGFTALTPARLADGRPGAPTLDGLHAGEGRVAGGGERRLAIAGRAGVPSGAATVVLNVTAADAAGPGYLTVYPCDARPNASSLNVVPGVISANAVITRLSPAGEVCVFASAAAHLIVDATGVL